MAGLQELWSHFWQWLLHVSLFSFQSGIAVCVVLIQAHKKVLDKHGKPDDVPPGIKDTRHPLPQTPLSGMYNKYGGKTRLTFKLDTDELWIGTKGMSVYAHPNTACFDSQVVPIKNIELLLSH